MKVIGQKCFKGIPIILYEPNIIETSFNGYEVVSELADFKKRSTVIAANRNDPCLNDVAYKVYTRDIFGIN